MHKDKQQQTGVSHEIVTVTPEQAQHWLDTCNIRNRKLSDNKALRYAMDMEEGRWRFNGEPIHFDWDGRLLNGQHRLTAVTISNKIQRFLVVSGLSPDVQITMDQGVKRNPRDQMQLAGVHVDTNQAAAIALYLRWVNGGLFGDQVEAKARWNTTTHLVEWAVENAWAIAVLTDYNRSPVRRSGLKPSFSLAVALRFFEIDPQACEEFWEQLTTLQNLHPAIGALRNRMDKARIDKENLSDREVLGYFTLAWNAWRKNRRITRLQRPKNGWGIEHLEPK